MDLKFKTIDNEKDLNKSKMYLQHVPQFGMDKSFFVEVDSPEEAYSMAMLLWEYDLFQFNNKIKSDYSNYTDLIYWNESYEEWDNWTDDEGWEFREHFEVKEVI